VRFAATDARWRLLEQITPGRLRKQTGKDDLGQAFLAVIEQAEQEAKTQSGTDG
jgi:hypothetical protein